MLMDDKSEEIPLIQLFGCAIENFYQLGLKDREGHNLVLNHTKNLIQSPWKIVNKAIENTAKLLLPKVLPLHPEFREKVEAYAQGIGKSSDEVAFLLLIPEIMSFMDIWVPGAPHTMFGCSSYFCIDEKRDAPIHGRILDFPLQGSFDVQERAILSQLDKGPKVLSFGACGFPYPSITAMNEYGVTLALHQKFDGVFYQEGYPIFELAYQILQNCKTRKDVELFIKDHPSLTTWALNMSFKNGDILSMDVSGKETYSQKYSLEPGEVIYLCNSLNNKKIDQGDLLPYGMANFNEMRSKVASQKIKEFKKKGKFSAEELIKMMGRIYEKQNKKPEKFLYDPLTPSTIQTTVMCPSSEEALFLPGPSPKFFNNEALYFSKAWGNKIKQKLKPLKGKTTPKNMQKAHHAMMASQVAMDFNDLHTAYHQVQKANVLYGTRHEANMAQFFFLVYQYINEGHTKQRAQLLKSFKGMEEVLPPYLKDHCLLFIARLEKLTKGQTSIGIDEIQNNQLQKVFDFEMKMPNLLFHKTTSVMMNPRIDILDIIYAHVRT